MFSDNSFKKSWGLPGGPVVKNPPAKAGDTGSIPDPEDPTSLGATRPMCHNHCAQTLQLLSPSAYSLCFATREAAEVRSHCNEKKPPLAATRESPLAATKTQGSLK